MENTLNIKTDYRIELISLIAFLSDLGETRAIDRSKNPYSKLLKENFSKFSNHPAVLEFPKLWNRGLCYDAIPFLLFHLEDDLRLIDQLYFPERLKNRYDGDFQDILNFLKKAHEFAVQTNFREFYESNIDSDFISAVNSEANNSPVIETLESYLNLKLYKSKVVLSNLFFSSFGVTINYPKGKQIYCVMSGTMLKLSRRNSNRAFKLNMLSIIWHEFLQSIINPLSDTLFDDPLTMNDEQMRWYCKLNESIIWAVTFRLAHKENLVSANDGKIYFSNAERNNAPKAKEMNELLIKYENDKMKYKSFAEFYPALQKLFGNPPKQD